MISFLRGHFSGTSGGQANPSLFSMDSDNLFRPLTSVRFEDKLHFSARQDLHFARSKSFKQPETNRHQDIWSIKPPDFSVKLYRSVTGPQKKDRKKDLNQPAETRRQTTIILPYILPDYHLKKEPPEFITSFRPPDPLQSELKFIRSGKNPSEPYKNPKPHDFRELDEDAADMMMSYEKDPGNLKLKLKHLDVIGSTRSESDSRSKAARKRMDTFKPAEPKWDVKLVFPQTPWPPKSASFTRHRRRRGAYSAFLDRVEEKLSRAWENGS